MRTAKLNRRTTAVAAVAATLTAGLLVMQASSAAFSDSTDNTGNFFVADAIALTDNDNDNVLYEVEDMIPGQVETRCITVSYEGGNDSEVNLYAAIDGADALASALDITIEADTNPAAVTADGTFTCPAGFDADTTVQATTKLDAFAAAATDYDNGVGGVTFTDQQDVVYRFTVEFDDQVANINDYQGTAVDGLSFTWEARTGN